MGRISSFDYARGIAIIAVVFGHATLTYMAQPNHIFIDSFLHNVAVFSVPLFLFMSGYLLAFKRQAGFWSFYKNKLQRIYLPTVIWIVMFRLLFALWGEGQAIVIPVFLRNIVLMQYSWQYYYIFALMLLFIIGYFALKADNARLLTYVRISFVINLLTIAIYQGLLWSGLIDSFLPNLWYHNPLTWIFFFMWGLYVRRVDPNLSSGWFKLLRNHKFIGIGLAVILWLFSSLQTWFLFLNYNEPGRGIEFFKITAFFYEIVALSYILIFLNNVKGESFTWRSIRLFGRYSFFIYLIHVPLVPRLLGYEWFSTMENAYYLNVLILGALQLIIPLAIGVTIGLFRSFPVVETISRYIGLPPLSKDEKVNVFHTFIKHIRSIE